jgi:ribonuclease-3|tara:strand:+ start:8295 stop:8966 length:672 start_codon:yes stop_codon:yes gene_type:complete
LSINRLQSTLDYQFKQEELLKQALTHRSFCRGANNERLEFLGDSVLSLVISHNIYEQQPNASEGDLSRIRASLVNEAALARVARDINLGDYVLLGGGELKSGGFRRESILSDTMEAILGAIYLDSNFTQVQNSILYLYRVYLQNLPSQSNLKDPKTRLQEYLQSEKIDIPEYAVVKIIGKSHDQTFTLTCRILSLNIETSGIGSSRKKAEQDAAIKALKVLKK